MYMSITYSEVLLYNSYTSRTCTFHCTHGPQSACIEKFNIKVLSRKFILVEKSGREYKFIFGGEARGIFNIWQSSWRLIRNMHVYC